MKIAVFHNLPPGGAKRVLYEQIKHLSKNNTIHIYELDAEYNREFLDPKRYAGKYYLYDFDQLGSLSGIFHRLGRDYRNFISLRFLHKRIAGDINKKDYDIVLVHTDIYTESPFILRYLKIPSVYYCHELLRIVYEDRLKFEEKVSIVKKWYEKITRILREKIDRDNAKCATKILTNSEFTRNKIMGAYGREADVCYPGVDANIFKASGKKENKILFVGNDNGIDCFSLAKKAINLIDRRIRPDLIRLGFNKKGPEIQNDRRLSEIYSSSLATLCLDYDEPFGLKVLESNACGTPVLAVSDGGYRETVIDGINGYFVRRNPREIAKKIRSLVKNKKQLLRINKSSRRQAISKWGWDLHNKKLTEIMRDVLGEKKILISGQDSGGYGGAEVFIYQLSKALKFLNHQVKFSVVSQSPLEEYLNSKSVNTNRYRVPFRMDILGGLRGFLKFIFCLPYFVLLEYSLLLRFKKENGRYVLLNGFTDKIIITPIAKHLKIKTIWLEYGPYGYLIKRNLGIPWFLYKMAAKMPDEVIAPSGNTKLKIVKSGVFKEKDITVIPCGIEIKKPSFPKNKRREFIIGSLSRIEKGKGQDVLIRSIPHLSKLGLNNFKIKIAGGGESGELTRLAKKLKVGGYVEFAGFVKDSFRTIAGFDIFVFPTTWELEGFGLVPLEAMMTGVPVVASNYGPVPEVVGQAGLVVKPTPEAIARAVMRVCRDINLRRTLIKRGFERVKKFDINKVVLEYEKTIFS